MPRDRKRFLQLQDAYFHVYNRGVSRSKIYFTPQNYRFFIQLMEEAARAHSVRVVGYCLMPNHFHFLLHQSIPFSITPFMQSVCNNYARATNKERKRRGHLFESRYDFKHVDTTEYLMHVSRYIHRNPLRAKLVTAVEHWPYSSYWDYCHMRQYGFVNGEELIARAGGREAYRRFVEEDRTDETGMVGKFLF